jgi:hypothetical protein
MTRVYEQVLTDVELRSKDSPNPRFERRQRGLHLFIRALRRAGAMPTASLASVLLCVGSIGGWRLHAASAHAPPQSHHRTDLAVHILTTFLSICDRHSAQLFSEHRQAAICPCTVAIFSRSSLDGSRAVEVEVGARAQAEAPLKRRTATPIATQPVMLDRTFADCITTPCDSCARIVAHLRREHDSGFPQPVPLDG